MNNPRDIRIDDYTYRLDEERIARFPLSERDSSKLLCYHKGAISESTFRSIPTLLNANELIVFNNTKVIQARLHFRKATGALIEIFCLEPCEPSDYALSFQQREECTWHCMVGNLKKWKGGALESQFSIGNTPVRLTAEMCGQHGASFEVHFRWNAAEVTFADILEHYGELPIPPYLNRATEESDKETYQTVYSKIIGSVAAPTAGLHFTTQVLNELKAKSIELQEVTLHVGAGTFRPVKSETMNNHEMHSEHIAVTREVINALLQHQCRVTAVGTTSVRTLESLYYIGAKLLRNDANAFVVDQWEPYDSQWDATPQEALEAIANYMDAQHTNTIHAATQILIAPGYEFHHVKQMVTNFHQPHSTLLLLVAAFIGDDWHKVYQYAFNNGFRFLSYGDSSLLIP